MHRRAARLLEKIEGNSITIGVLGLGYVGLPLAVAFAKKGVTVLGFEKSEKKAAAVNRSENYIADVANEDLARVVEETKTLQATADFSRLGEVDAILICVPTPLDKFKKPNMGYIADACEDIASYMTSGTFISLESTTYPTTTEEFMLPVLEKNGLKLGEDFWLCYSPERVDPGNKVYKTHNTPKVLGALGDDAKQLGMALYGLAIEHLYPVSTPRVAEMVKILENTYRLINISLINELALLAGKMDIDIWEVIEAAKTKPYGFQPFYPGPGIGGHCIPLDPFYLEYIAKLYNFDLTMINTAGHIDTIMPHRMVIKISFSLNKQKKSINGSKILFLGVAYKPDISDERESPALRIIDEIAHKGGIVSYHDPYIPEITTNEGRSYASQELNGQLLASADCVVITTNHSCFDSKLITDHAKLVVDMRNAVKQDFSHVYKL
jgi:UDP-N-acetyl-D-glucosamine dehydrogenase